MAGFFDRVWISAILLDEVRGFADGHYRERNENELVSAL